MQGRHEARIAALQALYQSEFTNCPIAESLLTVREEFRGLSREAKDYCDMLLNGVAGNMEKLDVLIERHSENWTLDRMAIVDRNILRIAAYELFFCPDVPYKVVIDEAVELAKKFANADSSAFINGILDKLAKDAAKSPCA